MAKKNGAAPMAYKVLHSTLKRMTQAELKREIETELNSENPRRDLITRMVGRYNRLRGNKLHMEILALMVKPGRKSIDALLAGNG